MIPCAHDVARRGLAMMGRLNGNQSQLFYEFNLDDVVPAGQLIREIDAVLDLSHRNAVCSPQAHPATACDCADLAVRSSSSR
jgi:hypothetical protein